MTRIWEL